MPLFRKKSNRIIRPLFRKKGNEALLEENPSIARARSKALSEHTEDRNDATASFKADINNEAREGLFGVLINSIITSSESNEDDDDINNMSFDLATVYEKITPLKKYAVDHVLGCVDFWGDCAVAVHETNFNTTLVGNDEPLGNDRSLLIGSVPDDTAFKVEPKGKKRSLFKLFDRQLMDDELAREASPTETIGAAEVNARDAAGTAVAKARENTGTADMKVRETTTDTANAKAHETNTGTSVDVELQETRDGCVDFWEDCAVAVLVDEGSTAGLSTEVEAGDTNGKSEAKTRENAGTAEVNVRESTVSTSNVKAQETGTAVEVEVQETRDGCVDFWEDCAVAVLVDEGSTVGLSTELEAGDTIGTSEVETQENTCTSEIKVRETTAGTTNVKTRETSTSTAVEVAVQETKDGCVDFWEDYVVAVLMDEGSTVGLSTDVETGDTIGTPETTTANFKAWETNTGTAVEVGVREKRQHYWFNRGQSMIDKYLHSRVHKTDTADIKAQKTTGTAEVKAQEPTQKAEKVFVESTIVHDTIPKSTYETFPPRVNACMVSVLAEIDNVIDSEQVALLCRPCCAPVKAADDLQLIDGAVKKPDYDYVLAM